MARKRQSPEAIARVLRQAESGIPIAELARKNGVHENTIHLWKKKYGSLGTPEIDREAWHASGQRAGTQRLSPQQHLRALRRG